MLKNILLSLTCISILCPILGHADTLTCSSLLIKEGVYNKDMQANGMGSFKTNDGKTIIFNFDSCQILFNK